MTRTLVLTNEAARHPFRRSLPPPRGIDPALALPPRPKWWKREDTHLFALSFWAFFTAFSAFIA